MNNNLLRRKFASQSEIRPAMARDEGFEYEHTYIEEARYHIWRLNSFKAAPLSYRIETQTERMNKAMKVKGYRYKIEPTTGDIKIFDGDNRDITPGAKYKPLHVEESEN